MSTNHTVEGRGGEMDAQAHAHEAEFRQLAESLPQFVWISDANGALHYVNAQWLAFSGLTVEQTRDAATLAPSFHPDDAAHVFARWACSHRDGALYEVKARMRRFDGVYRWFLIRSLPVKDQLGRVTKWFGTSTDIHAEEEAAQDARFLADFAERLRLANDIDALRINEARQLGLYLHAARCYFAEVDEASDTVTITHDYHVGGVSAVGSYRMSDYSPATVAAAHAGRAVLVDNTATHPHTAEQYATAYAATDVRAYLLVPLLRSGSWVSNLVVTDAAPRAWQEREVRLLETVAERLWLATENVRANQALRESEARLQLLYAQEQAARAEAEAASRLKDEFLATVSHELRTPLTAILGYAHLLRSRQRDADYVARTAEQIVRSAQAQVQLTEDLLDVSRIVTGKLRLELQPTDMAEVIYAAAAAVHPALDAKTIRLRIEIAPHVAPVGGDAHRLQQVVWNMLSNAAKFTPPGGSVLVRWQQVGDQGQLTVADTGEGISPEFLPFVFDRFRQADSSSTRAHGGLGLGLAIVRHLTELHGGTITVESDGLGQGATFTITLPLLSDASAAPQSDEGHPVDASCPPELDGLRVLIVDDQPVILELLHDILAPCGTLVTTCTRAGEALALLQTQRPDVLLSDIAMPGEDGYWLIRQVRALPADRGGSTPAAALTAYVRVEDRLRVLEEGFQHYIPKPIEPAELRAALVHLVSHAPPHE